MSKIEKEKQATPALVRLKPHGAKEIARLRKMHKEFDKE